MTVLSDEPGPGDLPDRLITEFEDAADVALFYYVGHGLIDAEDQLCLGTAGSRTEVHRRAATSLQFGAVRRALLDCPAAMKIIILDCCFSGLATLPAHTLAASATDVLDKTVGTGAYTMAASSAYGTAWFETDPAIERPQTYFTRGLCDLIGAGIPGQPAGLSVHQIFRRLQENLSRNGHPVPQARSLDAARDFVFARNAAPAETWFDARAELERVRKDLADTRARENRLLAEAADRTRELDRLRAGTRPQPAAPLGEPPPPEIPETTERRSRRLKKPGATIGAAVATVIALNTVPSGNADPVTSPVAGTVTTVPATTPLSLGFFSTSSDSTVFYDSTSSGTHVVDPHQPKAGETVGSGTISLQVGAQFTSTTAVFTALGGTAAPAAALRGAITLNYSFCGAVDVSFKVGSTEVTGVVDRNSPLVLPQNLARVKAGDKIVVSLIGSTSGTVLGCGVSSLRWADPGLSTVR